MSGAPRIPPGDREAVGPVNAAILKLLSVASEGRPLNVFSTLARHRSLFRRWLVFAGALMPGGKLPRAETELVILRVAHNCGSAYERDQHERIARTAGLTHDEIARTTGDPSTFPPRHALLLRVADALHADRDLPDDLWAQMRAGLSEAQCIELLMLVGHYEGLAMTLNALRVQPDAPAGEPPRLLRRLGARARES